jgi:hypothetical protein
MNPIPEILPREIDDPHLRELLRQLALGLERTVNFGTHMLKWFVDKDTPGRYRIVIAMLLRQYLELLDAVSILIHHCSAEPCKLLLRSMFEVLLYLEYMMQEDSENRANAYMVTYIHSLLKQYQEVNPTTPEGQERLRKLNTDQRFPINPLPVDPSWALGVQSLNEELALPSYAAAKEEYEKFKSRGVNNPRWYSLFGGPKNVEQLAARIRLSALYHSKYRMWSQPLHGTDVISNRIYPDESGRSHIVQLRFVGDIQSVCADAFLMSLDVVQTFLQCFLPEHGADYAEWWQTNREYGVRITGPDFINVAVKPKASGG